MNPESVELSRLREIYQERDRRLRTGDWRDNPYHPRHPVGRLFYAHDRMELVHVLNRGDVDLAGARILDVGCGHGGWLRALQDLGAEAPMLHGLDLARHRLRKVARSNPRISIMEGDAGALPFADASFDIVLQILVLSSVLLRELHERIAEEIMRVTRPGGHVVWLDLRKGTAGRLTGFSRRDAELLLSEAHPIVWRRVHPRYFRTLGAVAPSAAMVLSHIVRRPHEAWLGLFQKEGV